MLKFYFCKWYVLLVIFSFLNSMVFAQFTEQWIARYNGPDARFDGAHSITVDAAGNVFVAGQSLGAKTGSDFITIKYNVNGNELWSKRYNSIYNLDDAATSIAIDLSGNVYVTGWSNVNANASAFTTIKYDALGNELWVRHYIGPGNYRNIANALGIDASGNVYITGVSTGIGSEDDYAIIKYDAAGNELWVKRHNGPGSFPDYPYSIAVSESGNVYVTGESDNDYVTIKYDTDGNQQWLKIYNGPGNSADVARQIVLDKSENVYVTGESFSIATDYDLATVKYSSAGNQLWAKRYNGPENFRELGVALDVDTSGNVYVTGLSYESIPQGSDYVTLKYDSIGNQQWVKRYEGTNNGNDVPRALAVDLAGNTFVTGVSVSAAGDEDYATVAYDTAGNELWVKRYGAHQDSADQATAIAVDNGGNVYVTGTSPGLESQNDIVTIKYVRQLPLKVDAGNDTIIYLGYGPDCINLRAKASGGNPSYSYVWSSGGKKSADITVCPSATKIYTVTVTDASGNTASDQIKVTVIDVRCENNKIVVCHNGKKLCIDRHAVEAHLRHGDELGAANCKNEDPVKSFKVDITPNPFAGMTRIQYQVPERGKVLIMIFDGKGRLLSTLVNTEKKPGVYSMDFNGSNLSNGIYYYSAMLITKNKVYLKTGKMVKIK